MSYLRQVSNYQIKYAREEAGPVFNNRALKGTHKKGGGEINK